MNTFTQNDVTEQSDFLKKEIKMNFFSEAVFEKNGQCEKWSFLQENNKILHYYKALGDNAAICIHEIELYNLKGDIHQFIGCESEGYFQFIFIMEETKGIKIIDQEGKEILKSKPHMLFFFASSIMQNLIFPDHYKGKVIEIIIKYDFLKEYVPLKNLNQSLDFLFYKREATVCCFKHIPKYLQDKLVLMADFLLEERMEVPVKIGLLKNLIDFIDFFFCSYLKREEGINHLLNCQFGKQVRAYLKEALYEDFVGVQTLAFKMNLSESTFKRRFKSVFNTTPLDYYRRLQMEEAYSYLADGEQVESVAFLLGFSSASSFIRTFKKYNGMTPGKIKLRST